jgi:hypothetical protein
LRIADLLRHVLRSQTSTVGGSLLHLFALSLALSWALWLLLHAPGFPVFDAAELRYNSFSYELRLALAGLLGTGRTVFKNALFVAITMALVVLWWRAVQRSDTMTSLRLRHVLGGAIALAIPLLLHPLLFSDDLHLYYFYGREIVVYGANPFLTPPAAFAGDPYLAHVWWKELPSAYGPVWLGVCAVLSWIAGDSPTAAIVVYRVAGLFAHCGVAMALWIGMRRFRPEHATRAALFYAWNPLALFEAVGNAHNDALVACAVAAMLVFGLRRAYVAAAIACAVAALIKPFAAVLMVPLLAVAYAEARPGLKLRALLLPTLAATAVALVLSIPLWPGLALVHNIQTNPASRIYSNSLWELIGEAGPAFWYIRTTKIQHPWLDIARVVVVALALFWIVRVALRRRDLAYACATLWVAFSLSLSWVWPWYFLPAIAIAAVTTDRFVRASATALTIGGLLFWITWPPPAPSWAPWLHTWRSLLLFGPILVVLVPLHVVPFVVFAQIKRLAGKVDVVRRDPIAEQAARRTVVTVGDD